MKIGKRSKGDKKVVREQEVAGLKLNWSKVGGSGKDEGGAKSTEEELQDYQQ